MGRTTGIGFNVERDRWLVDKHCKCTRLYRRFESREEAERWLAQMLHDLRQRKIFGERPQITFAEAAVTYL